MTQNNWNDFQARNPALGCDNLSMAPTEFAILITTVIQGENNALATLITHFKTKLEANEAIGQINDHYDAEGRYEQVAIALYRP